MLSFEEIKKYFPEEIDTNKNARNIIKEYLQHIAIETMMNEKIAESLVFIGGTCLKYFYGIKRFSEDIDFDILPGDRYNMKDHEELMKTVNKRFEKNGFAVELKTDVTDRGVVRGKFTFPGLEYEMKTSQDPRRVVFLKIEAQPQGLHYEVEKRLLNRLGVYTLVNVMPLDYLFASKIATALIRGKGRDIYDIVELSSFAKASGEALKTIFGEKEITYTDPGDLRDLLLEKSQKTDWQEKENELKMFLYDSDDIKKIKDFEIWVNQTNFKNIVE